MPNETILRIPRNDDVNDFVLVNVTDKGPHILKLVGTEGQAKYSASCNIHLLNFKICVLTHHF